MSGGEKLFAIIKARMKARKNCCFKESDTQIQREPVEESIPYMFHIPYGTQTFRVTIRQLL